MSGRRAWHVWTMLLVPPVTLGLVIVAYAAAIGLPPGDPDASRTIRAALPWILAVNHLALFGLLVLFLHRDGEDLAAVGWTLERQRGRTLGREAGIGLACALGLYLMKELAFDPVVQLLRGDTPTFTSLFAFQLRNLDAMAAAAVALPFVEETIYRGYTLPFFHARWGTAWAILLTSVAFGFLHWGNGVQAIVFGSLWAIPVCGLFLWRRNLVPCVVAHSAYNLMVTLT